MRAGATHGGRGVMRRVVTSPGMGEEGCGRCGDGDGEEEEEVIYKQMWQSCCQRRLAKTRSRVRAKRAWMPLFSGADSTSARG